MSGLKRKTASFRGQQLPGAPEAWSEETIAVGPGVSLRAYERGSVGVQILHAHGLTQSTRAHFRRGTISPNAFSEGTRLICYDARGHGRSDGSSKPEDYTWKALARDMEAVAVATMPDEPVIVMGHSMGVGTALHWAATRSNRIAGVMPDMQHTTIPAVLRGAAASDFPAPEELAEISVPTLIMSWQPDGSHPVASGKHLRDHIPGADLRVASSRQDVWEWGNQISRFIAAV